MLEATLAAGAARAYLIEKPVAAAIGAGLNIDERVGHCVVDIGGGTTDAAVISQGGIVVSQSIRVAGLRLDEAVSRHLRKRYNLMIGDRTAETIKIRIGSAWPDGSAASMEIRGRDLIDGMPKTMGISSDEVRVALEETVNSIVEAVEGVLERAPKELVRDIAQRGITLTGGGALLKGLDICLCPPAPPIPSESRRIRSPVSPLEPARPSLSNYKLRLYARFKEVRLFVGRCAG